MAYRSRFVHWLLHPPSLPLVRDGQILHRNLRSQLITKQDLLEQLREQGVESIDSIKKCYLESDGRMSVVQEESDRPPRAPEKRKP
jgi:uncharacterized membrane protein YcaP (DUF421 family)